MKTTPATVIASVARQSRNDDRPLLWVVTADGRYASFARHVRGCLAQLGVACRFDELLAHPPTGTGLWVAGDDSGRAVVLGSCWIGELVWWLGWLGLGRFPGALRRAWHITIAPGNRPTWQRRIPWPVVQDSGPVSVAANYLPVAGLVAQFGACIAGVRSGSALSEGGWLGARAGSKSRLPDC